MLTDVAPAEREVVDAIAAARRMLCSESVLPALLDSIPLPLAIVTGEVQTVICNRAFAETAGYPPRLSLPPDFELAAYPLSLPGQSLTLLVPRNVAAENRQRMLERVFLHDILNTASGLQVLAEVMNAGRASEAQQQECLSLLSNLSASLLEEIQHHRNLLHAESGEFCPKIVEVEIGPFLEHLVALCVCTVVGRNRELRLLHRLAVTLRTDPVLLRRILVNLIRNAAEATPAGGVITLACEEARGQLTFSVHNAGRLDEAIARHIFEPRFSTKPGQGRGLGTYGAKLFGEKYLKGDVSFTTSDVEGTVFRVRLPHK